MLIHFGVTPYLVFDGDYLPSKAATEHEREKKRDQSKKFGLEMYHSGKVAAAHKELQKAVDVTPLMARELIEELKSMNISYVVAPYEADAQLAYLEQKGIISAVLSEDSDLLVFGTKCLLTKLDQYGDCVEINREDFTSCREISLVGWSDTEFRRMAILSGCDYLRGIPKMGLMKAYRLVRKYKDVEKIIRMVQFDGQFCIPPGYSEAFQQAERTFMHQRIFCPLDQKLRLFSDIDGEQPENFDYVGKETDPAVAIEVAVGNLDPITKEPLIVKKQKHSTISPRTPYNARQSKNDENLSNKKGQSIETFFKPKRTPLAELDPNCFTPSPTQLRLQQQQTNATWQSSTVPVDLVAARSVQSAPSSSVVHASSITPSSTFLHNLTPTMPPKRRRLCDDNLDVLGSPPAGAACSAKSRFFPTQTCSDDLHTGNGRRRRKQRMGSMNIWSDDSIEDAMANLPDITPDNSRTPARRVAVYSETLKTEIGSKGLPEGKPQFVIVTREAGQAENDLEESVTSTESSDTRVSTATSVTSVAEEDISFILDASIKSDLAALTKTYLYEPMNSSGDVEEKKPVLHGDLPNANVSQALVAAASSVTEQDCSNERMADNLKITPAEYQKALQARRPGLVRSNSLTPLGKLGAHALHQARSYSGSSLLRDQVRSGREVMVPSSAPAPGMRGTEKSQAQQKQELPKVVHHRVAGANPDPYSFCGPEMPPLPEVERSADALPVALEGEGVPPEAKGSEDLMIPDSEGSDVASISEQGSPRKPKLDLARFGFCDI